MSRSEAGGLKGASNPETPPSREEFNSAIENVNSKLEALMSAVSRVVPGTPPAAAGGREESRGGRHTAPGAGLQADRAPNTADRIGQEPTTSSVGDASRESDLGEPQARGRYITPRLKQLNFDGLEENWPMFRNDFITQAHACRMMGALKDARDTEVHELSDADMLENGVQEHEIEIVRDLWVMLVGSISDKTTKLMVYSYKGPAAAWRALEQRFAPLTGGEQISLIGKFFTAKQEEAQDPHEFYQQFMLVVSNLEMAFDQPIPKMLVHARFLDALLP